MDHSREININTQSELEKRLRWGCRRGMLELDLLLLPFFEKYYSQLSPREQTLFETLLKYPDPDLYGYLTGGQTCDDPELQALCNKIRHQN